MLKHALQMVNWEIFIIRSQRESRNSTRERAIIPSCKLCRDARPLTYPDAEVVEGVLVDVLDLLAQAQRIVSHGCHVTKTLRVARCRRQACNMIYLSII